MSSVAEVVHTPEESSLPLALWLRQIGAIMRLELGKNFFSRRSILIYLIAALPLLPVMALAVIRPDDLLYVLTVVALIGAHPKETLLQEWVLLIPERNRKVEPILVVRDAE